MRKRRDPRDGRAFIKLLDIRTPSATQEVRLLSGGNQQKIVIAKWLARDCDILFFDEPTRGIDVGAKSEIYKLLRSLADQGKAIVMISSELPEILRMSDRIVVMCEGRITGELSAKEATQERSCTWRRNAKLESGVRSTDNPRHGHRNVGAGDAGTRVRAQAASSAPTALQKLLAFASLILLLVFFSFASPAFMQMDNMHRHPAGDRGQRRAGDRLHLRHHHRRHRSFGRHADDLLRGHGRRVSDLLASADVDRRRRRARDGRVLRADLRAR